MYELALIRYCVQPEEEAALHQFFFFHAAQLEAMSTEEIQQGAAAIFAESCRKPWRLADEVVEKWRVLWLRAVGRLILKGRATR